MSSMIQFGRSANGLVSQQLRDLDAMAPRPPKSTRALPDDVRAKLKKPQGDSQSQPRKVEIGVGPRVPKKSTSSRSLQGGGRAAGRYDSYSKELNHMERI